MEGLKGKLGLVLMGGAMSSKSLTQFSVDGWGCVPSLLFDLRPNYGGGNDNKGSVQLLIPVRPFETPRTAECQASLSITNSQSLLKLMSTESVMPSNHLILCHPLFLLPSTFPSIQVFSNESVLHIRWPKYWSFSSASVIAFSSVQSLSRVRLFANTWTAARQAFLSFTISQSLFKLMSIDGDAIQPSHPLSSPSPPAFNLSQHQDLL